MITKSHAEDIKKAYGFDKVIIEKYLEGFGSKYVALLNTNEGKYVLKGMYNRDLKFFTIYEYLKKHKYPHLINIKNPIWEHQEHLFTEHNGVVCYLYDYIYGENLNIRKNIYFNLGLALAKLHNLEFDTTLPIWDLVSVLNDIRNDRIPDVSPNHQPLLKECLEHFQQILSLPKAIIHGDVGGSNVIVNVRDKNLILIDWDGSGVAPRIIELGHPLFGLLSDDLEFQWNNAKELLKGYMTQIRLTNEEKNNFIYAAILLPCNNILFGDTEIKLKKIKWFLHNENQIKALLN